MKLLLSKESNQIVDEIKITDPRITISIGIEEGLEKKSGVLGKHNVNDATVTSTILIDSNNINNAVVTHELLHCYFYCMRFPRLRMQSFENKIALDIIMRVENVLIHKLIQKEQDRRSIDTNKFNFDFVSDLGENIEKEPDNFEQQFKFAFKILDAKIRCKNMEHLFEERIRNKFPESYGYAKRLYELYETNNYMTQFEYRRMMVKFLRLSELILKENWIDVSFRHLVSTEIVPSSRQLELSVEQIFNCIVMRESKNGKIDGLYINRADGQNSYFVSFSNLNEYNLMKKKTLKEFLTLTKIPYVTRC